MCNLLWAEIFKLRKSVAYRWLLAACLVWEILFTHNEILIGTQTGVVYTGMEAIYQVLMRPRYLYFGFILAAEYVTGEFAYHTFSLGILGGNARTKIGMAKAAGFLAGMLPFLILQLLTEIGMWTARYGFLGKEYGSWTQLFGKSLLCCLSGYLFFGGVMLVIAFSSRSRLATVALSFGIVQILGTLGGNAEYIPIAWLRNTLLLAFQWTYFYQPVLLHGSNPALQIPFGVNVFSTLLQSILLVWVGIRIFDRCDIK